MSRREEGRVSLVESEKHLWLVHDEDNEDRYLFASSASEAAKLADEFNALEVANETDSVGRKIEPAETNRVELIAHGFNCLVEPAA